MTSALALQFENSFARELEGLFVPWQAAKFPAPELLVLNDDLAAELGLDAAVLRTEAGVRFLVGAELPADATPIAQGYAGHQFGGYSPRLGDGRALLLGELLDPAGARRDIHLKGSGATPFSRGGDGKAAVGPMLREYIIGEAMHALGVPTTRALAVVATGQDVLREEGPLPGALVVRIAASHLRVGSFQYASALLQREPTLLRRLADYAIARHYPDDAQHETPYLMLLARVRDAQAQLVASWMSLGFVHGVMNTDNVTISGETIDYGPCAFMEAYDPATVFSSIDHAGRYAYGNQPSITLWNLSRFGEALLPLIAASESDADMEAAVEAAVATLDGFAPAFERSWATAMTAKIGIPSGTDPVVLELVHDLLRLMKTARVDWTTLFRSLSFVVRGDATKARDQFLAREEFDAWAERWLTRLDAEPGGDRAAKADAMDRVNPVYIPRNHKVEEALAAGTKGDLAPLHALLDVLRDPFTERPGRGAYAEPSGEGTYVTFCGT